MRIRHIIRGRLNPDNADGIITHTHRLARAQKQLGHDVEVYGVASRATEPEVLDRDGLLVRAFPWSRNPLAVHPALRALVRECADATDTIFHLQPPHDPAVAAVGRLLRHAGIPYFVSPHAMWNAHALSRGKLKKGLYKLAIDNRLVRSAAGVHATAAAETPEILAYAPGAKVFVVRNSIDVNEIESIPTDAGYWQQRFGVAEGKRVFVFLGRLDPYQKGLDVLLQAWGAAIAPDDPAVLALVGTPWRDTYDDLVESIGDLPDPASVLLTGPIYGDEKYQALASAHVYVQTSRYETSPYSIQEALASGLPAIVTPGTNFDGVVGQYGAGFPTTMDPSTIASALRMAMAVGHTELQTMGSNARRLVRERHSLDRAARRMVDAYLSALTGQPFENDD